ncbi:MAG: hypothetical protein EAZ89_00185 [Bacteroidetes bacterium]|nr:MAG: hypothetical protein EAZ89_00185 [Bacteroidota bacterium]
MSELDIQHFILRALSKMSLTQQYRLLAFINSIVAVPDSEKPKGILRFAGVFDATDAQEFKASLRDCE